MFTGGNSQLDGHADRGGEYVNVLRGLERAPGMGPVSSSRGHSPPLHSSSRPRGIAHTLRTTLPSTSPWRPLKYLRSGLGVGDPERERL